MTSASAETGDQASSSSQQTGQAPQANNGGSSSAASQAPQAGGDHTTAGQTSAQLSSADYERIISDLRKENAAHRTEGVKTAAELKKFQDAQLTEHEKRE